MGRIESGGAALATAASMLAFAVGAAVGGRRATRMERKKQRGAAQDLRAEARPPGVEGGGALDCAVCLGELVLPRVAPCGHSLCTSCLAALWRHERRPQCPVCRRRIKANCAAELPVNFTACAVAEARARAMGVGALEALRKAEAEARSALPCGTSSPAVMPMTGSLRQLRPAWNWFKWTAIIVTEFGAFLVSLKEVLEAGPSHPRRYQRIV